MPAQSQEDPTVASVSDNAHTDGSSPHDRYKYSIAQEMIVGGKGAMEWTICRTDTLSRNSPDDTRTIPDCTALAEYLLLRTKLLSIRGDTEAGQAERANLAPEMKPLVRDIAEEVYGDYGESVVERDPSTKEGTSQEAGEVSEPAVKA